MCTEEPSPPDGQAIIGASGGGPGAFKGAPCPPPLAAIALGDGPAKRAVVRLPVGPKGGGLRGFLRALGASVVNLYQSLNQRYWALAQRD